jgi:hypothetical protein
MLIWVRADDRVATGDERRYARHAHCSRLLVLRRDAIAVSALIKSGTEVGCVDSGFGGQPAQDVSRGDVSIVYEVGTEDRVPKRVAEASLVRPFGSFVRGR